MMKLELSPNSLNLFKDCPRCFYKDKVLKIKRPEGKFSSLPNGLDRALKAHFDKYRAEDAKPSEIEGVITGKLFSEQEKLNKWRNWRSGLACMVGDIKLSGAIDDGVIELDGLYSPLDFKGRGFPLKEDTADVNQDQLDLYALMFAANEMPSSGKGYLDFYWPKEVEYSEGNIARISFNSQIVVMATDLERAINLVQTGGECLKGGILPASSEKCKYCAFIAQSEQEIRAAA